ncbi:unnamed protein product [Prunus armeniaca]|uniref:Uncharacterized protein n=1 Tax=Prunus armeniaca TaxID=36596 RepID=A0A6J5TI73_PRUAR|nr:unnamed protein product [Prunus armeniaca]
MTIDFRSSKGWGRGYSSVSPLEGRNAQRQRAIVQCYMKSLQEGLANNGEVRARVIEHHKVCQCSDMC